MLPLPGSVPGTCTLGLRVNFLTSVHDGGGPSTSSQGSQSPNHEERLDQGERLAPRNERLGREGGRLPMERLDVELDRLGPLTRSMAKYV